MNGAPNNNGSERNGVGCAEPAGSANRCAEAEVLPPYVPGPGDERVTIGRVAFEQTTLIKSPCFWMLIGIGIGVGICYGVAHMNDR